MIAMDRTYRALLPGEGVACPFCGSTRLNLSALWVECADCEALGPTGGTEAESLARWNARHTGEGMPPGA